MLDVIHMIRSGGIFMYGILAASLVAVSVIVQRLCTLWILYRLDIEALRDQVVAYVDQGEFGHAVQICGGAHPLQKILVAALQRANRSEKEIRRGLEGAAVTELARMRRGTATLPQLSNLATLLGLLGTIHGLIISFSGMQGIDAAARQAALSKGVAVAFYNTFFGLTVATVTVVAYLIVFSKQSKEMIRIEDATSTIIDHLLSSPDARSGGKGAVR
ncbi:MAG: MotA/TolQ/ExbB proton channel family protein [Polyangiaceae bacterium]|jgi:biopolymer transport protein ExbB/TolQ